LNPDNDDYDIVWTTSGGNIVSGANSLNPEVDLPGIYTLTASNNTTKGTCEMSSQVQVSGIPPTDPSCTLGTPPPTSTDSEITALISEYPWLNDIIDLNTCQGTRIRIFSLLGWKYFYIDDGGLGKLYFQDGTLFCTDADPEFCIRSYNFEELLQDVMCETGSLTENPYPEIFRYTNNLDNISKLIISPNPTSGIVNISFNKASNQIISLKIYDVMGKEVINYDGNTNFSNQIQLNLNHLANGIYYIQASTDQDSYLEKIIKSRH